MSTFDQTIEALRGNAESADISDAWPAASWNELRNGGVLRWNIPSEFGGDRLSNLEAISRNEMLGGACLTTAFILSQREAAVRRLLAYPVHDLQQRYLPAVARGDQFLTVGLSQLTTSRQHGAPALLAEPMGSEGYRLNGLVPWVTGADRADAFIIGAVLSDQRQLLFVLPVERPGVTIDAPMPLAALRGSRTCLVRCENAIVSSKDVLAGPDHQILGKSGGGGLETSCLALGLACEAAAYLEREAEHRDDLRALAELFLQRCRRTRDGLHLLAAQTASPDDILAMRVRCTKLALRISQTVLAVSKGTGFVSPHPAQRWARQALFFLVWSCPQPAAKGILADLAGE